MTASQYREQLQQALRRRGRVARSAEDELTNGKRIAAGRNLMKFYAASSGHEGMGDAILQRYLSIPGRGDEYDFRSTGVDAISDILHFARSRGILTENVISAIEFGDNDVETEGVAYAIHEIGAALNAAGHDFADALETATGHVGMETPRPRTP